MNLILTTNAIRKAFAEQYKVPDTDVRVVPNVEPDLGLEYRVEIFEPVDKHSTKMTRFEVKFEAKLINEVIY